jgi:hypothetical protein
VQVTVRRLLPRAMCVTSAALSCPPHCASAGVRTGLRPVCICAYFGVRGRDSQWNQRLRDAPCSELVLHARCVCCTPVTTVLEAAHPMQRKHIGDLVVVRDEETDKGPLGVITARDVVAVALLWAVDSGQYDGKLSRRE